MKPVSIPWPCRCGSSFLFLCLLLVGPVAAQSDLSLPSQTVVTQAVSRVASSVVQINTIGGREMIDGLRVSDQPGTGLWLHRDQLVVTATCHIAHEPTAIFVRMADGQRYPARIVSQDFSRKLAILKVDHDGPATPIAWVDRSKLAVGQTVIAVGRGMDWRQANLSTGILSALQRLQGRALQTDAAISPLNFGGPLIDLQGRVIGILVPLSPQGQGPWDGLDWYDSGIGFAVPLPPESLLANWTQGQDLFPGKLGVTFKQDQGYASLPLIAACSANSPAARAGLRPGDQLTRIDDTEIQLLSEARQLLGSRYAGETLAIHYLRAGQPQQAEVQLTQKVEAWRHAMLGVAAVADPNGLTIRAVMPGGPAEAAGIQANDQLVSIDSQEVNGQAEVESVLMGFPVGSPIEVVVSRGGNLQTLPLRLANWSAEPWQVEPELDRPADTEETIAEWVPLAVPESPNLCHGYFPQSAEPCGLLLWLEEPGQVDLPALMQVWRPWCDATQTALLVPQSLQAESWSPDEAAFLSQITRQTIEQYSLNTYRVAVGGTAAGGVMASLVAMHDRSLWRGCILQNAEPSGKLAPFQSEPGFRQMILMLHTEENSQSENSQSSSDRERWVRHLQTQGFPVHQQSSPAESASQIIMAWTTALGRF